MFNAFFRDIPLRIREVTVLSSMPCLRACADSDFDLGATGVVNARFNGQPRSSRMNTVMGFNPWRFCLCGNRSLCAAPWRGGLTFSARFNDQPCLMRQCTVTGFCPCARACSAIPFSGRGICAVNARLRDQPLF